MVGKKLLVALSLSLSACTGVLTDDYPRAQNSPSTPGKEWIQVSNPSVYGWDEQKLAKAHEAFHESNVSSLMVIDDGRLIAALGSTKARWYIASMRKSLLSLLYGIQVERGTLDLESSLAELNIDEVNPALTQEQKKITVRQLLMSSSNVCHGAVALPEFECPKAAAAPGTRFLYNNFDFNVLGSIYRKQSGEDIFQSFHERIGKKIGLEDFDPARDGRYDYDLKSSLHPAYVFSMSTRDLARVGLLAARGGRWGNQQLVSQSWIQTSTSSQIQTSQCMLGKAGCAEYGYLWWRFSPALWAKYGPRELQGFAANGAHSQLILVFPSAKLVVVARGHPVLARIRDRAWDNEVYAVVGEFLRAKKMQAQPRSPLSETHP